MPGFDAQSAFDEANSREGTPTAQSDRSSWWSVLRVSRDATVEQIETAYRELARLNHPDHWQNALDQQRQTAERLMKAINAAFEEAKSFAAKSAVPSPSTTNNAPFAGVKRAAGANRRPVVWKPPNWPYVVQDKSRQSVPPFVYALPGLIFAAVFVCIFLREWGVVLPGGRDLPLDARLVILVASTILALLVSPSFRRPLMFVASVFILVACLLVIATWLVGLYNAIENEQDPVNHPYDPAGVNKFFQGD